MHSTPLALALALLSTATANPISPNTPIFPRAPADLTGRMMIWRSSDCSGEPAFQFQFDRQGGCFEMHDVHSWMWEGTCNVAHNEIYESGDCTGKSKGVNSGDKWTCQKVGIPHMGWGSSGIGCDH